jgi:curved DNA-binding protein CbpA
MNGHLAQRALIDVLADVQRHQASGVLRIQKDATTRQMFIDAGIMIRFAVSTLPTESITALFRSKGAVTDEQLRQATAAKLPEELLGTTITRLGLVTRETLAELTREHIHRVVLGALAMRDGTYEFQAGALPFREQLDGGLSTPEILLEWARALPDAEAIRRRFGDLGGCVKMSPRPPEGYQKISLNPAEGFIMSRVDGRTSVGEICMVSPMGEDTTLRALFGLTLAGILDMPEGAAEIPFQPTPPLPHPTTVPEPAAPTPSPALTSARAPTNGGAAAAAPQTGAKSHATARTGARPAGFAKPAGARAGGSHPARRPPPPATKPRVASIVERVRPATPAELEIEMLQRFGLMLDQDLYQVLGVPTGAPRDDVRRAYYGLAKKFHPDKFTREDMKAKAEKVFAHITEAYSTLSNAEMREKYDEDLAIRKGTHSQEKKADGGDMAHMNFKHGKEMFDKGKIGEAVSFLQNACDQDPTKAEHFHYLAQAQSRNPRWKKDAEENFLKALERDPTNAEIYAQLGSLYAKGGLHSKARDMFKKALEWDPESQEALDGLAQEDGGRKGILGMFKK